MGLFPMVSCREATELHSRGMDEKLGFGRWISLKVHLKMCPPCANAASSMDILRRAMRSVSESDQPRGDRLDPRDP